MYSCLTDFCSFLSSLCRVFNCRKTPDLFMNNHATLDVLPEDMKPLLQIFLEISGDWSQPNLPPTTNLEAEPLNPSDIQVWSGSINQHQDWSPNLSQLKQGMDLHSLVSLRRAFTCLTSSSSSSLYLEDYTYVPMTELKVWFYASTGSVVVYFPVSIAMSFTDVYHVGTGRIEDNQFARYIQAAAKRNFKEFQEWFQAQKFNLKTLKLFGHSRGGAVADFFWFLGRELWGDIGVTLVRAAPLASLGRSAIVEFDNVDVRNIVLVGESFRDPYTRCQKNFKHPESRSGPSIFLHVK